jgi:DNA polymerase III alpha subunit
MSELVSYQLVVDENDVVNALLCGAKLNDIVTNNGDWIDKFNRYSNMFDLGDKIEYSLPVIDSDEYITQCVNTWGIPQKYLEIDIESFLYSKCVNTTQKDRVHEELILYKERNLIILLKFMIYFVDTLRKHNILWGVGRGSSVSSYILYLIGIHRIDSIKYDLNIGEFLK